MRKRKVQADLVGPQVLTWPGIGEVVDVARGYGVIDQLRVHGPCEDSYNGHWYCITHEEHFNIQLHKDFHIHSGEHQLVWLCNQHGAEVSPKWGA